MRPQIIALGRSDNHPLLASHAKAIGVDYLGVEAFEASDLIRDSGALRRWVASISQEGPVILAAIDSSVPAATLNSFTTALNSEAGGRKISRLLLRSDPSVLQRMQKFEREVIRDSLQVLSVARSPHGQISTWPLLTLDREGSLAMREGVVARNNSQSEEETALLIDEALTEVSELSLVGVINYIIDPKDQSVVGREFGASTYTFWSESASHTSITEQIVRSILDLPLGDTRTIDFEEYFLEEEISLAPGMINDPTRPLLHLYARNPRLKIRYRGDEGESDVSKVRLSLYAATEDEARHEMNHAKDFMLGRVDEHAP